MVNGFGSFFLSFSISLLFSPLLSLAFVFFGFPGLLKSFDEEF